MIIRTHPIWICGRPQFSYLAGFNSCHFTLKKYRMTKIKKNVVPECSPQLQFELQAELLTILSYFSICLILQQKERSQKISNFIIFASR